AVVSDLSAALEELCQGDEGGRGTELLRSGPGRGRDVGKPSDECGDRVAVAFEGGAFVVGEVELLKHRVDSFFDGQELASMAGFGQVERAPGTGEPVRAFGEEVVAAVALAQVVVLPGLTAAGGGAGEDDVAVDENLDGAHVAGEVVGLAVGRGQGALQDRCVGA